MSGPRRLYLPEPVAVRAGPEGRPRQVAGREVGAVRESWLVEDRWWTSSPLRRRYWEIVTEQGEHVVIFRDLGMTGAWFRQRGTIS